MVDEHLTNADLDAIEARLTAAVDACPLPWHWDSLDDLVDAKGSCLIEDATAPEEANPFFEHCAVDMRRLLAEVRRLRAMEEA